MSGKLPILDLPTDRPRPPVQTDEGGLESIWLGPELTQALKTASRGMGATRLSLMLAAFQTLLHRYTGQTDILLGFPRDRRRGEVVQVIGYFVNSVVMRGDLSGDPTFADLVGRAHQVIQGAFEHDAMPLSLLAERLQLKRDLSRPPLFQVMFAWQKVSSPVDPRRLSSFALSKERGGGVNLWGLEIESAYLRHRPAPFDLTFLVAETDRYFYTSNSGIEFYAVGRITENNSTVVNKMMRFKNLTWVGTDHGLYNDANSLLGSNVTFGPANIEDNITNSVAVEINDIVHGENAIYACGSNSKIYRYWDDPNGTEGQVWSSYTVPNIGPLHKMLLYETDLIHLLVITSYNKIRAIDVTPETGVFG